MSAAPSTKRFGRRHDDGEQEVEPIPFVLDVTRDGKWEEHEFRARPELGYGDLVGIKVSEKKANDKLASLPHLDKMIRRSLCNDDGTPDDWHPEIADGRFVAPDGADAPVVDLDKYLAHEAGSSRRRWAELVDDVAVKIHFDDVMEIFEWLAKEASGGRPTGRSQRS